MSLFGFGSGAGTKRKEPKAPSDRPADRLRSEALANAEQALICAAGIPGTADALAFEPTQGLVAVATSDGKVKLFGRPGCETTVYSAAKYPYATRQLHFLQNRGGFVRVSKGGFMESWSVAPAGSGSGGGAAEGGGGVRSLGTVKVRGGDKICCVADMARDPYLLLGCASGSLRIAMLVDAAGQPTAKPRQAYRFKIAPYRVRPHEMGGEGEVRQLAVQSFGPVHRALVLFTGGMVAVWDLRAEELVTSINPLGAEAETSYGPALAAAGEATAACWIGTERGDFATGHVDGSVLVWVLPGLGPGRAEVAAVLRVVAGAAEPVRLLRCAFGEVDGLLVLGGQEVEQPEGLTWLPLPRDNVPQDNAATLAEEAEEDDTDSGGEGPCSSEGEDEDEEEDVEGRRGARARRRHGRGGHGSSGSAARWEREPVKLPWFGHLIGVCLVVEGGSITGYEAPSAVLQLVEGGQLVLYDLREGRPANVSPYFQQRTSISVTEAPMVPLRRPAGCSPNAITLTALRVVADQAQAQLAEGEGHEDDRPDAAAAQLAAFTCGTPPPMPADATWGLLYCTGYKDGGVCLWDLHGGTTRLLCATPAGDAAAEVKRGPSGSGGSGSGGSVSCLSLVWPTGLLLSGHHRGEVRMYQFSATERRVDCVTLESINTPGATRSLQQPAGLQLRLRVQVSSGEVTSLAYCQSIRSVAVGDKAGGVALVDTARPLVRWYAMPAQAAVLGAALAPLPLPPARLRAPEVAGEEGAPSHAVVIADSEGRLAALDAARGCFIGRNGELSPKNRSHTLLLELLDAEFNPLWARRQVGAGCDQSELGGAKQAANGVAVSGQRQRQGLAGRSRGRGEDDDEEADEEASTDQDDDKDDGDDEDIDGMDADTLLAMAAMQVDAQRRRRRDGGEVEARRDLGGGGGGRGGSARSRDRSGRGGPVSQDLEKLSEHPAPVLSSCPDPVAQYVLLVTDQYLRLYSAAHVVTGERSTIAKRSPPAHQQLVYARPVQGRGGAPGVMALAAAEHGLCVQVYSLPSLDLLTEAPLSASLSWFWDVRPGRERRLGCLAATSRLGHLLLLGLNNELLCMGLAQGLPRPAPPGGLFNLSAASASLAATASFEDEHRVVAAQGRLMRRTASTNANSVAAGAGLGATCSAAGVDGSGSVDLLIEGIDSPIVRTEGRRVDKAPAAAAATAALNVPRAAAERVAGAAAGANVTLTRVFSRVQQGLSRAVVETTRGVRQLATNVERGMATLVDGGGAGGGREEEGPGPRGHSAEWYASLPDLGAVFSRTVPEDNDTLARVRRKQRQPGQQGQAGRGGSDDDGGDGDDDDVSILTITDDDKEEEEERAAARPRGGTGDGGSGGGGAGSSKAAGPPSQRALPMPHSQPVAAATGPGPGPGGAIRARTQSTAVPRSAGGDEGSAMRNELFAGARPLPHTSTSAGGAAFGTSRVPGDAAGSGGISQPRARTADEIKRAYGRQPTAPAARANDLRGVMEENMSRLHERGEKLRQLNDKAADLESSATGFAEMARQLAERERNKRWWQL